MRRIVFVFACILLSCGELFSQHKPLSPVVNIPGVFKEEYEGVEKGTPFVLQKVVKLKKDPGPGVSRNQAVLVMDGVQFGLPMNMLGVLAFRPDDKNAFWQIEQLSNDLIAYYEKKGYQESMRKEQAQEADDYLRELEQSNLFYEDAAVEDYLQCMLLSIVPDRMVVNLMGGVPHVRILKSPSPDMLMLANHCLLVSTGMLTTLDTEEELFAMLSREVAHYVLDHAMITVNKAITRAKRAEFWGTVMEGAALVSEAYLSERYDYYEPGAVFATAELVGALVNYNVLNRMGLDYSEAQEKEADEVAKRFLQLTGKNCGALVSALTKVKAYYTRLGDFKPLTGNGAYATLPARLEKLGKAPEGTTEDRIYLKKTSGVVSYEATLQDYNKNYKESRRLATKNVANGMACPDDYLMVARSIMKQSNTPEANRECLSYLDQADALSKGANLNSCKMRILLLLRANKQMDAVDLLHRYQDLLNAVYQQPHTEEDARWIAAEHTWAEKLLERTYIM